MKNILFYVANIIIGRFSVDVYKHPEYASNNGKTCNRNYLVAECLMALEKLKRDVLKEKL